MSPREGGPGRTRAAPHPSSKKGSPRLPFSFPRPALAASSPPVNLPNPALVTQRGARPLPRLALLLLCAAYVLPGLAGRDPWRNADLIAFAQMLGMAEGRISWLAPTLGQVAVDGGSWLPNALGAAFIIASPAWMDAALAARLPFALMLALTLSLTWYATFHLARTERAQPLALAFGGEADPVGYARAIADGAVLALLATLGLLQLGHETTPELVQLFAASLFLYGLAAGPFRRWQAPLAVLAALPALAASGAPAIATALGGVGAVVCARSAFPEVRRLGGWVLAATAGAVALATSAGAWRWRLMLPGMEDLAGLLRQWLWFLWPTWPLVLWTLWRWRGRLQHRHLSVPLTLLSVAVAANIAMDGSDRALMLGVPGAAVLAAFALPTFKRSTTAAIDWFSMFFFSLSAVAIWVIYVAMHTGVPAKPAANVAKLAPGFTASFSPLALAIALAGTVAWLWLLRWRTGRHREALWKSLVLPAGGVALSWLLLMSLWLPLLDYARSMRPWIERLSPHLDPVGCVWAPDAGQVAVAALETRPGLRVDARGQDDGRCPLMLKVARTGRTPAPTPGWTLVAEIRRPTDREEITAVYRRGMGP